MKKTLCFLGLSLLFASAAQAELVIYSDRIQDRFADAIAEYEAKTGDTVRYVEGGYGDLVKRLVEEGSSSPADVILAKDLVYLADLQTKELLQSFEETSAVRTVPAYMRADQNEWVGLSYRARTVAYNPGLVNPSELSTYADLADEKWIGSLCLRTSKAAYNEALVAGLILKHGEEGTKNILAGWMKNLALDPVKEGGDRGVLDHIARGRCAIGIVNHYYLAGIKATNPSYPVEIAFLDQNEEGVLTNGVGLGLLKTADNKANAQIFLEILLTEKQQLVISGGHFDFPAVTGLVPDTLVKDWGPFKTNPLSWERIGEKVPAAISLMNAVGYQ